MPEDGSLLVPFGTSCKTLSSSSTMSAWMLPCSHLDDNGLNLWSSKPAPIKCCSYKNTVVTVSVHSSKTITNTYSNRKVTKLICQEKTLFGGNFYFVPASGCLRFLFFSQSTETFYLCFTFKKRIPGFSLLYVFVLPLCGPWCQPRSSAH